MLERPQLYLISGLPASGKSVLAKAWAAEDPDARIRVNFDELRLGMFGEDWRFNREQENQMKAHADSIAKRALNAGLSVVIDNTNLTNGAKNHWRQLGKSLGVEVTEEELCTPVAECVRRDKLREGKARVGRAVIERMALFTGWIDWNDEQVYHRAASGKDFVIVDVDGTLAGCEHRRHYIRSKVTTCNTEGFASHSFVQGVCACGSKILKKDWGAFFSECGNDPVIEPIKKLVKILEQHYYIIVVSGRPIDPCGRPTEDWLLKAGIDPLHLFTRNGGDKRQDVVVKQEILDLLPKERIAYVLDDRPAVLRMWQASGITTLAVGDLKEF